MPSIAPVVAFTRRSRKKPWICSSARRHPSLDFGIEVPQAHFDASHELVLRACKRHRRARVDALHCLDQRRRVAGEVVEHQHFVRLENVEAHTVLGTELLQVLKDVVAGDRLMLLERVQPIEEQHGDTG